jgi:hypothetical protein
MRAGALALVLLIASCRTTPIEDVGDAMPSAPPEGTFGAPSDFAVPHSTAGDPCTVEGRANLVLVLDFSGSMYDPGEHFPDGSLKIDMLRAAVNALLDRNLDVAIGAVLFGSSVGPTFAVRYDAAHSDIRAALSRSTLGATDTGDALLAAGSLLGQAGGRGDFVLLMTDGLPTAGGGDPWAYARSAADTLRGAGVTIFTVDIQPPCCIDAGQKQLLIDLSGDAASPHDPADHVMVHASGELEPAVMTFVERLPCVAPARDASAP